MNDLPSVGEGCQLNMHCDCIILVMTCFWHNVDYRVIWTLLISGFGLTS